ncbi:hypothetical protein Tco_0635976 [Tanacetum coccineum]
MDDLTFLFSVLMNIGCSDLLLWILVLFDQVTLCGEHLSCSRRRKSCLPSFPKDFRKYGVGPRKQEEAFSVEGTIYVMQQILSLPDGSKELFSLLQCVESRISCVLHAIRKVLRRDIQKLRGLDQLMERKEGGVEVGNKVMLEVSSWKDVVHFGKKEMLAPRYMGPFEIIKGIGLWPFAFKIVDKTLRFAEEPVEINDHEVKSLKRSRIPIVNKISLEVLSKVGHIGLLADFGAPWNVLSSVDESVGDFVYE